MPRAMTQGSPVRATSIRLPDGLHEAVEACARAAGMSFNAAVTAALIDFVASEDRRTQVAEFFSDGLAKHQAFLDKLGK